MKSARNKVRVQKLLKVASDRYREEPQLAHGQHTPRVSGASQLNTHLERAWASGLTLEFYEQRGQMHDGAMASKYSLPAGGRLRTVSGRSSVRDPSIELNERSTVSSRPNEVGLRQRMTHGRNSDLTFISQTVTELMDHGCCNQASPPRHNYSDFSGYLWLSIAFILPCHNSLYVLFFFFRLVST